MFDGGFVSYLCCLLLLHFADPFGYLGHDSMTRDKSAITSTVHLVSIVSSWVPRASGRCQVPSVLLRAVSGASTRWLPLADLTVEHSVVQAPRSQSSFQRPQRLSSDIAGVSRLPCSRQSRNPALIVSTPYRSSLRPPRRSRQRHTRTPTQVVQHRNVAAQHSACRLRCCSLELVACA